MYRRLYLVALSFAFLLTGCRMGEDGLDVHQADDAAAPQTAPGTTPPAVPPVPGDPPSIGPAPEPLDTSGRAQEGAVEVDTVPRVQ